jgi:hypothetical protein
MVRPAPWHRDKRDLLYALLSADELALPVRVLKDRVKQPLIAALGRDLKARAPVLQIEELPDQSMKQVKTMAQELLNEGVFWDRKALFGELLGKTDLFREALTAEALKFPDRVGSGNAAHAFYPDESIWHRFTQTLLTYPEWRRRLDSISEGLPASCQALIGRTPEDMARRAAGFGLAHIDTGVEYVLRDTGGEFNYLPAATRAHVFLGDPVWDPKKRSDPLAAFIRLGAVVKILSACEEQGLARRNLIPQAIAWRDRLGFVDLMAELEDALANLEAARVERLAQEIALGEEDAPHLIPRRLKRKLVELLPPQRRGAIFLIFDATRPASVDRLRALLGRFAKTPGLD